MTPSVAFGAMKMLYIKHKANIIFRPGSMAYEIVTSTAIGAAIIKALRAEGDFLRFSSSSARKRFCISSALKIAHAIFGESWAKQRRISIGVVVAQSARRNVASAVTHWSANPSYSGGAPFKLFRRKSLAIQLLCNALGNYRRRKQRLDIPEGESNSRNR